MANFPPDAPDIDAGWDGKNPVESQTGELRDNSSHDSVGGTFTGEMKPAAQPASLPHCRLLVEAILR